MPGNTNFRRLYFMSEFKPIDPTACGLLFVAAISFPLALSCFVETVIPAELFMLIGAMIMLVAVAAWRAESAFGFTVFLLVGAAVFATGYGIDSWGSVGFGIIFLFCIIWSIIAKTPRLLTLLLITTAFVFLLAGLNGIIGGLTTILGVVAALNFLFNFYLGMSLATEGKIPAF